MNLKTKGGMIALGALAAAGFIIWPGCASPPLPSKHQPLSNLQSRDFAFEKGAHPTREEVFARLGEPDEYFYVSDSKVACYRLERLTRHRIDLFLFILPVGYYNDKPDRLQVAFLQFDDHDRLVRSEVKIVPEYSRNQLRNAASHWSKEPSR